MGRLLRCWIVVPLLAAPAAPARAQDWEPIGPSGGAIESVAVDPDDPDTAYAIGNGQLYRSTDGGRAWQSQSLSFVLSVAVADGGAVFVGGRDMAWKSSDGGDTWEPLNALRNQYVFAIAVDPAQSQIVHAMTAARSPGVVDVVKSLDGGATWAPCCGSLAGPSGFISWSLLVDPSAPDTLYALIPSQGVFKSVDGADWEPTGPGLPGGCGVGYHSGSPSSPIYHDCLLSLAVDPSTGTLYVGSDGHGIYRSADGGDSWDALGGELTERAVRALAVDGTQPDRLFAGIATAHDPATGETIEQAGGPVYRSEDGGAFWTESSTGLGTAPVAALAIGSTGSERVYVATAGEGVSASRDGGETWRAAERGLNAACLSPIASAATMPTTVVTGDLSDLPHIFASSDGGDTWVATQVGRESIGVISIVVDDTDPSTIYAASLERAVWKSTDGGRNWARRETGFDAIVAVLAIDPGSPVTFYAPCGSCGVIKSSDGAATWTQVNAGLPSIYGIAVDHGTGTVYATMEDAAFKSSDGGATWTSLASVPNSFEGLLAIAPTAPATLFAATAQGVSVSRDEGDSWEALHLPGVPPTEGMLFRIAISPANPSTVYTMDDGQLLRSDDAGRSWRAVGINLDQFGNGLVVDANRPEVIYASTCGAGVFALRQADSSASGSDAAGCSIHPQPPATMPMSAHLLVVALLCARRSTSKPSRRVGLADHRRRANQD